MSLVSVFSILPTAMKNKLIREYVQSLTAGEKTQLVKDNVDLFTNEFFVHVSHIKLRELVSNIDTEKLLYLKHTIDERLTDKGSPEERHQGAG